ncbi:hypothetical protein O181_018278 [Austropuccinia psidii MF-1]|uniref:CCHC-type domain-containing protein n=1 Tax=Austropuccinia psidii MF-1 TaxID=1389203 RepID=A0A9Q3C7M4_9BASI|nr:hypothetical protein [Austropuccinia psidii MF-1]
MSAVHLRKLCFQRNQPEDREGLSRTRRPGRGHLGHSDGWQDTEGNHTHYAIHFSIQQEPQTRGLERHGSSFSAPPTPQRFISMEHAQQEVQPGISLGRTWSKLPQDLSQRDRLQRPYGNHQKLESYQEISGQESPFFTIPGHFQEKTRIQGQKQDHLQLEEERVRPNDPEAVGLGERSAQEPEVAVNKSRISSPLDRNITPTQIEHNVVTPESNLNSDELWLQWSQFAEKTQKQFSELQESQERMKKLTASMDKIVKTLQEGHAHIPDYWITARLDTAFKQHASIWYTEMKELHGRRSWPWWKSQIIQKYSNGTWIWQKTMSFENDKYFVDKDPYEWCLRKSKRLKAIHPQMNFQMWNHKLLTQIPGELEHAMKCRCNHNCTLDEIANTLQDVRKRTNIGRYTPYKSSGFKEKQPFRMAFRDKPRERVAEVAKKKNYCHSCGSTDHYSNNCPKAKKKVCPLRKSQRRNPQQRNLTQTLWEMPLENNLMKNKTQENNF